MAVFNPLMWRRGTVSFHVFDCLWLNGGLSKLPLLVRTQILRRVIPGGNGPLVYVAHSEVSCAKLFEAACRMDLEGVVVKYKLGLWRGLVQVLQPAVHAEARPPRTVRRVPRTRINRSFRASLPRFHRHRPG